MPPSSNNSLEILRKCHHGCLQLVDFLLDRDPSFLPLNSQVLLTVSLAVSGRLEDDVLHLSAHGEVDELTGNHRQQLL